MTISGSLTVSGSSTFNNVGPFNQSEGDVSIISPNFGFSDLPPRITVSGSVGFKSENLIVSGSTKLEGNVVLGKNGGPTSTNLEIVNSPSAPANSLRITMVDLPTSDPSEVGRLYNDSGTLKISLG